VHDVHRVIARLSGNPLVALFVESLIEMTTTHAMTDLSGERKIDATYAMHLAHERIVDAMVAGDISLAKHRMLRHLTAERSWVDLSPRTHRCAAASRRWASVNFGGRPPYTAGTTNRTRRR
jgi:DNA-binding FadR family transcriptional regulator